MMINSEVFSERVTYVNFGGPASSGGAGMFAQEPFCKEPGGVVNRLLSATML